MRTTTFFRRLLPALLLVGFALSSCESDKDGDPRPKHGKCGSPTSSTKPGGAN